MRKKRFTGFDCQCSSKGRSLDVVLEESQGVLTPFFFSLVGFIFGKRSFGGKVVSVILTDAEKEIIKSPNAGSIPERESAEDGIKRGVPEHAAPDRDGSYF